MAPGRQVEETLLSLFFPPFPMPDHVLPPIFRRTQHVVPAFIIIVIIISVDGPLMNRCEGYLSRGVRERLEGNGAMGGRKEEERSRARAHGSKNSKKRTQKVDRARRG